MAINENESDIANGEIFSLNVIILEIFLSLAKMFVSDQIVAEIKGEAQKKRAEGLLAKGVDKLNYASVLIVHSEYSPFSQLVFCIHFC